MLGIGVAVGAAIGPAPDASFAGGAAGIAQQLPQLIAAFESPTPAAPQPTTPASTSNARSIPAPASTPAPSAGSTPTPSSTTSAPAESEPTSEAGTPSRKPALPAITNVWLVELDGATFAAAKAQPAAAPYITGQFLPGATLLGGWSALAASAFASETVLVQPPAPGATPPLLHSIVQPPCPEGAVGAACAPGTPGQLSAADGFLKATLAQITATASYREHGLVVVTFASVGIATQQELPVGASSATLTYQPPAGAALLSPFAHAGVSSTPYDPTSPVQSLEKLLH